MQSRSNRRRRRANAPTFVLYDDEQEDVGDSHPVCGSFATLGFQSLHFEDGASKESYPIKHSPTVTKNLSDYFLNPFSSASFSSSSPPSQPVRQNQQRPRTERPSKGPLAFGSASSFSSDGRHRRNGLNQDDDDDVEEDESAVNSDSEHSSHRGHRRSASEHDPKITELFRGIPWATMDGNQVRMCHQPNYKEAADFHQSLAQVVLDQRSPTEAIKAWQSSGPFPPAEEASGAGHLPN